MNINGRHIPFLKIAVPSWIGFLLAMGFIGHGFYLESHRPSQPDASLGFVIKSNFHREALYISPTDQLINLGLWGVTAVYLFGVLIYFWRSGLFKRNP